MTRSLPFTIAAIAVVVTVGLAVAACAAPSAPRGESQVVEVVDGDTIVVHLRGRDEHVRLLGVDTPETKHPTKPVECFGHEASSFTRALLPPGTTVRLEQDVEAHDAYGRLLAYVYRADGVFANLELVARGFAAMLVIEPNHAHARELSDAEARARAAGFGLWGACGGPGRPAGR